MYRQVILFLQEQKIQEFDFLKDTPTRVYKKNQAGDVILENGKTVLVAQGLNDYQSKVDELRR